MKNFLRAERREAGRRKRGGGAPHLSIEAGKREVRRLLRESADDLSPDRLFDRQWATTLLETVVESLASNYRAAGKDGLFEALRPFLPGGTTTPDREGLAESLGMTESALGVAIHRLRQRYAKALREAIADTLAEGEDPDDELRHLMDSFG